MSRKMPRHGAKAPLKKKEIAFDNDPKTFINAQNKKKRNPKSQNDDDDTPKSFRHFMEFTERLKEQRAKGGRLENVMHTLDNGEDETQTSKKKGKKRKADEKEEATKNLKMEPGESWTDFNRRVNEALPLVHAKRAKVKEIEGLDPKGKKGNKNTKGKKGNDQGADELEDEEEEDIDSQGRLRSAKRGSKRDRSPDPWAHLEKKKQKPKFGEVADAPPDLKLPAKFLNNIPKSAGSMAKRYMLEQERERFIEGYRALLEKKKAENGGV